MAVWTQLIRVLFELKFKRIISFSLHNVYCLVGLPNENDKKYLNIYANKKKQVYRRY